MNNRKSKEVPVIKNRDYIMDIDNLGSNGEGIGRIDGFTMFVTGALPGERVKVKAVKVGKRYGYGKLIDILKPSDQRVEPICQYAKRCGGCQLQHMSYELQLEFKKQLVKDALERIGNLEDIIIHDTLGMEEPWHYRNKMQFPIGMLGDKPAIGFYAPRSHNLIDIDTCHIQHSINDTIVKLVREYINEFNIPVYDETAHKGILRHLVSKVGFESGEVMVVIVTNGTQLPKGDRLVERLRDNVPGLVSVVQNVNSKKTNVIMGGENIVLWGRDHIVDYIDGLKFRISPLSFFQVNPIQTAVLYNKALDYARLKGREAVLDAYCGIGTISLFMARKAAKVYGIEVVPQAIEDARINALENDIHNVEFIVGQAELVVQDMIDEGLKVDVIVVDPPRKGCDEKLLEAIIQAQPERMVYVSCNPATLARDLAYLSERGYRVVKVQPVDMFPQTAHVEVISLMSRVDE